MIYVGLCHEEAMLNVKQILLEQGNPYCPWWGWVQWRSSALFIFTPGTFFFSCSEENLCWVRFHLWQWALHPSQVEMWRRRRMSWRVRWIRSSLQWVAQCGVSQTCSLIKAQRIWSCYSQHLQDDLSIYASVRTKITDTKDSGHSNHTVYKLSNVPVFETTIQAVLSSLDFCLQGNCKHVELFVRLMISSSVRSVTLTWDQAFWKLRFGVLHGNILGFIISVDSNSVITEELCNVTALLNLHFLFFLWEQMKKAADERWAM